MSAAWIPYLVLYVQLSAGISALRLSPADVSETQPASRDQPTRLTAHVKRSSSAELRADELENVHLGLPNDCLTYSQRYKQYQQGLGHGVRDNAKHPHSRYVVVLKIHSAHGRKTPQDIFNNVRALATEVTEVGYHFYILFQVPKRAFYMLTDVDEPDLTRQEILEALPHDLHPFVILHDFEADFAAYPELGKNDDVDTHPTAAWGPGPRAAYVAVSQFMQRYKAYQFAWVVEYDVRWTGRSWGELLNAVLSLGQQATAEETDNQGRLVPLERPASVELPRSAEGLPDLLSFNGIRETDKWKVLPNNLGGAQRLWETWTVAYGGSRRLWDAVHKYSAKGIGSHIETALTTIALQHGMKAASVELPRPPGTQEDTFHCCLKEAQGVYTRWFNESQVCLGSYLLHPVVVRDAFWPAETLSSQDD